MDTDLMIWNRQKCQEAYAKASGMVRSQLDGFMLPMLAWMEAAEQAMDRVTDRQGGTDGNGN